MTTLSLRQNPRLKTVRCWAKVGAEAAMNAVRQVKQALEQPVRPASGIIAIALASCLTFSASHADAQTDQERAGARAAANQGVTAYEAGNYKDALSFMERAENLVHA